MGPQHGSHDAVPSFGSIPDQVRMGRNAVKWQVKHIWQTRLYD